MRYSHISTLDAACENSAMKTLNYPVPDNETERLNTLRSYDILDTEPENRFDDLTLLATKICGTPGAVISLVDENRQWFKSRIGVAATQTSREEAICAYAIMSPDLFIVADAAQDTRFAHHSHVLGEHHVRFYAGAPLEAPNGHRLGALCVIDHVPRRLKPEQLESLHLLARQVMSQMTLGKYVQDMRTALQEKESVELDLKKLLRDFQNSHDLSCLLDTSLPICYACKKVRDERGCWVHIEAYLTRSIGIGATSSICPECLRQRFGHASEVPNAADFAASNV